MIYALMVSLIAAAPSYDVSSWDLSPGSIPRTNATGDTPAATPVIAGAGIVTDPSQVAGTITNLIAHSSDIVSGGAPASPWDSNAGGGGSAVVCSVVSAVSPEGGVSSVTRLQISATPISGWSQVFQYVSPAGPGGTYGWSFWAKAGSGSSCSLHVRMYDTATRSPVDVAVTDQWQRFSGTATLTSANQALIVGNGNSATGLPASDVLIWGAQVESVGNLSMPGPYVATTTASASGVRGEYNGQPSDPGILVPAKISDPRTWGVGVSASKASWAGADAIVDLGGQLSGYRWNSARLETTAGGALVFTVIDSTGASATRTVAAHGFADGSTHKLAFGAFDGTPILLVDGVDSGTLAGAAVLSSFPSTIGINSTVHPVAKTVYRVSQGPTPWSAQVKLK